LRTLRSSDLPRNSQTLVAFGNAVVAASTRPLDWLHLPVPIERDDDAYFAALSDLSLTTQTELYLGLVHSEDGVEGAQRRIATARRHVPEFGVSTECGIGSAQEGPTDDILQTHQQV